MKWIQSKNKITFYDLDDDGIPDKVLPTNKIRIHIDKEAVLKNGIVSQKDSALIVPYIDINIGSSLTKNRILMLDILANNHWKRPIYFTGGAQADEEYIWMKDYLQLDGLAYKLVPIKTPDQGSFFDMGRIETDILYKKIKNWDWGTITDDNVYLDPETRKNAVTYRNNMERLVRALIKENKMKKAEEILDISLNKMPVHKFGHYSMLIPYVELYYKLDKKNKAQLLTKQLKEVFQEDLTYFSQYNEQEIPTVYDEIERNLLMYDQLVKTASKYDDAEYTNSIKDEYISYLKLYDFLIKDQ
jgi:hypothetical protein